MNSGISMIETLRDFVEKVDELGIDYMVTGSYAMSVFGEIRMTRDIDVVIHLAEGDVASFFDKFKDDYYISDESIIRALSRRSMFNVVSLEHGGKIDCIIQKDTLFGIASFSRRYKVRVSGIEFWTSTLEDLVIAKLDWAKDSHSEMQIRDIAKLTLAEYDAGYVDDWIERLGLQTIWTEVERWKTLHSKQIE